MPKSIGYTVGRWCITIIFVALALWPIWLFLLVKYLLSPEGFWQELVVYGLGFWFLGGIQILMIIVLFGALSVIWDWKRCSAPLC